MTVLYSLTMIDAYKRTRSMVLEAEEELLLADQITAMENVINQLQAVTDLGLVRADLIYKAAGTPFAVTAGANRDVGATFQGLVEDGNGKTASVKVPSIKAALVNADGTITLSNADVEDWLELFAEDTPNSLFLSDGETIDYWLKGTLDK